MYSIVFHEGIVIALLELLLFHDDCVEGLGEAAVDLIDYTVNCVTHLIGLCNANREKKTGVSKKSAISESTRDEFERQASDIRFSLGIKSITILSFLMDRLDKCPLSAGNRLVQVHDVPCLLSEILHLKPWLRFIAGENSLEIFNDGRWNVITGDDVFRLNKTEAHTWLALRQLVFNHTLFQQYEMNDFRQTQITKCQLLMTDQLLDQIPQLGELKQFLCSSGLSGRSGNTKTLIIEQLPEIRDDIMAQAKKVGWERIVSEHIDRFIACDQTEVLKAAKRLNEVYNTDFLTDVDMTTKSICDNVDVTKCAKCMSPATKRCAQCESVHYCCRSCQVSDWTRHKTSCVKNILL